MEARLNRNKGLFDAPNFPYYISGFKYDELSGGIRALHRLCHALNMRGEEAYVATEVTDPALYTPVLTPDIIRRHRTSARAPIFIDSELMDCNPFAAPVVARFMLRARGTLLKPIEIQKNEIVFSSAVSCDPVGIESHPLWIPITDSNLFSPPTKKGHKRAGSAVFFRNYLQEGGKLQAITNGMLELSRNNPRPWRELPELFRNLEFLYTYEHSTICIEAMLCGCPVVYLVNDLMLKDSPKGYIGEAGFAWGNTPEQIEHAKETIKQMRKNYLGLEEKFWAQLDDFILITQSAMLSRLA